MVSSQTWEAWKGLDAEFDAVPATVQQASGSLVMLVEVPMNEDHPFFREWSDHMATQSHQGC